MKINKLLAMAGVALMTLTIACSGGKKVADRDGDDDARTDSVADTTSVENNVAAADAKPVTFDIFCRPLTTDPNWQGLGVDEATASKIHVNKDFALIASGLSEIGFSCTGNQEVREFDEAIEEWYTYTKGNFERTDGEGTTKVEVEGTSITISFPSAKAKDLFIDQIVSKGYKLRNGEYSVPGNETCYWVGNRIQVDGNKVSIIPLGGY